MSVAVLLAPSAARAQITNQAWSSRFTLEGGPDLGVFPRAVPGVHAPHTTSAKQSMVVDPNGWIYLVRHFETAPTPTCAC